MHKNRIIDDFCSEISLIFYFHQEIRECEEILVAFEKHLDLLIFKITNRKENSTYHDIKICEVCPFISCQHFLLSLSTQM